ncbi:MAG: hypothetical protein QOJ82_1618 [Solirubrobacteraceae bacterium]|nr:hypothetical protein [Solirubrobacteraceae bacterium]
MPEGARTSAASDAAVFTLATYGAQVLLFAAGLVQKGLMGPVATGFWSLMQTAWVLLAIASLGTMQGSTRQIPLQRGRREYEAAAAAAATGSSFSLLAIAGAGALLAGVAVAFGAGWAPELRWGLVLLGLTAPLRLLCDCHQVIFQATKRFGPASQSTILDAAVMVTAGTLFVWLLGFYGMFAMVVTSCVAQLAFWTRRGLTGRRRPAFRRRIDRRLVHELVAFGAPIMILGQIWMLFLAADNLIVAGVLGVKQLGYYALAVSVTTYVLLLPRSIGTALFPRMIERFAHAEDVASIRHYAVDVQRLLAYLLLPAFVAAACFGVPVLIRQGLPQFTPAIDAVRIMVAGSYAVALISMPTKVLITAGYRWALVALLLACVGINAGANLVAVGPLHAGIQGAAAATSGTYVVTFVVLTAYALGKVLAPREVARHVAELLAVFAYVVAALWAIEWLVGPGGGGLLADAGLAAVKLAVFLVAMAPWLLRAQARYGSVGALWSLARAGARRARRARPAAGRAAA